MSPLARRSVVAAAAAVLAAAASLIGASPAEAAPAAVHYETAGGSVDGTWDPTTRRVAGTLTVVAPGTCVHFYADAFTSIPMVPWRPARSIARNCTPGTVAFDENVPAWQLPWWFGLSQTKA